MQFNKIIGMISFLVATGCAMRSLPPAPIINVTQIPSYAQSPSNATENSTMNKTVAQKPELTALRNDKNDVQTENLTTANDNLAVKPAKGALNRSWHMPTNGVLGKYTATNKGINISGTENQPIYAVENGKVLYSGNGLKWYGNLIIIRHENSYLSAYAYNRVNLVKEGAVVKQGQKIATMGLNNSGQAMLHFEIRKNGKPIDPHTMISN